MIAKVYGPSLVRAVEDALETMYCAREAYEGAEASISAAVAMLRGVPTDSSKHLADRLDDFLCSMPPFPGVTEEQREQAMCDAQGRVA